MKIEQISKKDFSNIDGTKVLIHEPNSRRFGIVQIAGYDFTLAWSSDLIEPQLFESIDRNMVAIGIDMSVAGISMIAGNIAFRIGLNFPFSFFDINTNNLVIVSTNEVLQLNWGNFAVTQLNILPDIIESIEKLDGKIKVSCMDGEYMI